MAGTTASHNKAGQYTRNRRAPVQPIGTGRRAFIRSAFGQNAKGYGALTQSQQAAWLAWANNYPIVDALGQSIKMTAQNAYIAINTALLNAGQPVSQVPPASNATTAPVITAYTIDDTGTITLTLDGSGAETDFILVAFSRPTSGGVAYMKTFWQATSVAANATTVSGITALYQAQFGVPTPGQRVFIRLTPVNQYGVTGTPLITFATVA